MTLKPSKVTHPEPMVLAVRPGQPTITFIPGKESHAYPSLGTFDSPRDKARLGMKSKFIESWSCVPLHPDRTTS